MNDSLEGCLEQEIIQISLVWFEPNHPNQNKLLGDNAFIWSNHVRKQSSTLHQKSCCSASSHPGPIPNISILPKEYDTAARKLKRKIRAQLSAARSVMRQSMPNCATCSKLHFYYLGWRNGDTAWKRWDEHYCTRTNTVVPKYAASSGMPLPHLWKAI
jgi:hypothetical protein